MIVLQGYLWRCYFYNFQWDNSVSLFIFSCVCWKMVLWISTCVIFDSCHSICLTVGPLTCSSKVSDHFPFRVVIQLWPQALNCTPWIVLCALWRLYKKKLLHTKIHFCSKSKRNEQNKQRMRIYHKQSTTQVPSRMSGRAARTLTTHVIDLIGQLLSNQRD